MPSRTSSNQLYVEELDRLVRFGRGLLFPRLAAIAISAAASLPADRDCRGLLL